MSENLGGEKVLTWWVTNSPSLIVSRKEQRYTFGQTVARTTCTTMAPGKKFELIAPPFELDALEPHMSKETMDYHWGKHHNVSVPLAL